MPVPIELTSATDPPGPTLSPWPRHPIPTLLIIGLTFASITSLSLLYKFRLSPLPGRLIVVRDVLEGEPILKAGVSAKLTNGGDLPVQILGIETSCGCASAQADLKLVPPGEAVTVKMVTTPMDVGVRRGVVTVKTDSPITPTIPLNFLVVGDRPAPHLLSAQGEILYRSGARRDEPRSLYVEMVEPRSATPKAPAIRCDLPFVRIGVAKSEEFPHVTRRDWVVRRSIYPITLDSPPSSEFAGDLVVWHPDDANRTAIIRVIGQEALAFQVTPRHLRLRAGGGYPGRLIVKPLVADSKIRLSQVRGDYGPQYDPLIIRTVGDSNGSLRVFDVEPGPDTSSEYEIIVSMDGSPDQIVVSVSIEREARP